MPPPAARGAVPWAQMQQNTRYVRPQMHAQMVETFQRVPQLQVRLQKPVQNQLQAQEQLAAMQAEQKRQEKIELQRVVDEHEGYFDAPIGYFVTGGEFPYIICTPKPLGIGVFSAVWGVADKDNKLVALKVSRKHEHFRKHAEQEARILESVRKLREQDQEGADSIVQLREFFMHGEYFCMAFEKLQDDLRSVGKLPLGKVLSFSKQLLAALRFLHEHVGLVHCDVKPDNLLMRHDGLAVKLTDFGATRPSTSLQEVDELQPLFYRAPEVYIGSTRGRKIDLWSAGCTIHELVTGRVLFRSCHTPREVLEKIMDLRGLLPQEMRSTGRLTQCYFSPKGFHPEKGCPSFKITMPLESFSKRSMLQELVAFADCGRGKSAQAQATQQLSRLIGLTTVLGAMKQTETDPKLELLSDLIEQLMEVDPNLRLTAKAATEHKVFEGVAPPPEAALLDAPPLPKEAPPPLPPGA